MLALDFEVAHCGDPAFDVAFLLTHLVLKARAPPGDAARPARRGARVPDAATEAPRARSRRPTSTSSPSSAACCSRASTASRGSSTCPPRSRAGTSARSALRPPARRADRAARPAALDRLLVAMTPTIASRRTRARSSTRAGGRRSRRSSCSPTGRARGRASRPAPPPAATRRSSSATATPSASAGAVCSRAVAAVEHGDRRGARRRRAVDLAGVDRTPHRRSTARRTSRASAPTPSSRSRSPARAPRPPSLGSRSGATSPASPSRVLPMPMVNIISGGLHAGRQLDFQDFLVIPVGAGELPRGAARWSSRSTRRPRDVLRERGLSMLKADEGGFGPALASHAAALELLDAAVERAGLRSAMTSPTRSTSPPPTSSTPAAARYALASEGRTLHAAGARGAARRAGRPAPDPLDRGRAGRGRLGGLDGAAPRALGDRAPARRRRPLHDEPRAARARDRRAARPTRCS